MTADRRDVHRHLRDSSYDAPLPTHAPLIPLDEMVRRIEVARLEAGPAACSTVTVTQTRVCGRCHAEKPLTAFNRSADKALGRAFTCRACARDYDTAYRARRKREQFREILGVAS